MIIYLNGNFTYLYSADFYLLSVASVEAAASVVAAASVEAVARMEAAARMETAVSVEVTAFCLSDD